MRICLNYDGGGGDDDDDDDDDDEYEYIREEICFFGDSSLDSGGINALILKGLGVLAPLVGQLDDG